VPAVVYLYVLKYEFLRTFSHQIILPVYDLSFWGECEPLVDTIRCLIRPKDTTLTLALCGVARAVAAASARIYGAVGIL